jgi:hypothetical protein
MAVRHKSLIIGDAQGFNRLDIGGKIGPGFHLGMCGFDGFDGKHLLLFLMVVKKSAAKIGWADGREL